MSGKVPAILYSLRKSALNPNEYASEIVKTTRTLPKCYSFIYIVVITYSDHDFGVQMTLNYTLQLCVRIHAPVFVNVRPHKQTDINPVDLGQQLMMLMCQLAPAYIMIVETAGSTASGTWGTQEFFV